MASPAADDVTRHNVFLSFRGIDTRDTITDHIHEALLRAALRTFRDDDEMERGRDLKTEIETAIKASESSIIVFSENFATSTWCLDELSLILEQMRDCNHIVLPVFYHVDPSDVRKQNGSFKIEVKDGSPRWTRYNVNRWRIALTMAANLTGIVLKGSKTKFVKDIVDFIYNKVSAKKFHLPLNLVRMDTRYEDINDWIKQSDDNLLLGAWEEVARLHWPVTLSMYQLKLLSLKHVKVSGSYNNFSNKLSWLCWIGFHEKTIPPGLSMRNLVALDMSNSCLVVFEISMALQALKILDLKDSFSLEKIRNFIMIPNLETLILCNCHKLVHVCETIGGLKSLVLLNMTGCKSLYKSSSDRMLINPLKMSATSTSNNGSTQKPSFPMPCFIRAAIPQRL